MSTLLEVQSQEVFGKLKVHCVPLLGSSLLTPASIPRISKLLSDLIATLREISTSGFVLTPSLVSYTFFPISSILRRNASAAIPNQVLEKILIVLGILCESWWWDCNVAIWEQIFMLCGAILGGIEGKGKGKDRDDETKAAAAQCLLTILRERTVDEDPDGPHAHPERVMKRLSEFQSHAQTAKFIPILGQTLDSVLENSSSAHSPLQRDSLRLLHTVITLYAPDYFIPSVLPGVMSTMTKIALGVSSKKGWTKGDTVALALKVMQEVILRSIGDDICIREGTVRDITNLEDIIELVSGETTDSSTNDNRRYSTARTASWLRGTSSQLHIALNTLTPLVSHPTPSALFGLSQMSSKILAETRLTLPQSQPLLLSFLLSLSNSDFPSVSTDARTNLVTLLSPSSKAGHSLLQTLMQNTRDNLSSLPRLLVSHADAKVEHLAGLITAVCRLSDAKSSPPLGASTIPDGITKLLGPTGGIERWGWSLLAVLEPAPPPPTTARASAAQLMLEHAPDEPTRPVFPEISLRQIESRSAQTALVEMFRALGRATGEGCLYAVEWFVGVGRRGRGARACAALWCACRLLEGASGVSLDAEDDGAAAFRTRQGKRLEKTARTLAKSIAELWDEPMDDDDVQTDSRPAEHEQREDDALLPVEHRQGLVPIRATLDITHPRATIAPSTVALSSLHRALCLHVLALTSGILQSRSVPLLLRTLYPVLNSLVSSSAHLAQTGLASLHVLAGAAGAASPAGLLLAHFDYALDAVARRLAKRWLDPDAARVLGVLVRLVGSDVVQRAGDVVEECFDRLDEYHGYEVIVDGLVEVLVEVIKVVQVDTEIAEEEGDKRERSVETGLTDGKHFEQVFEWLKHRHELHFEEEDNGTSDGHFPREAWGKDKDKSDDTPTDEKNNPQPSTVDPTAEPPPTPTQALTQQIVARSLYFLTHPAPTIRARILTLLAFATPVLPSSALLPSIHHAWPFVLNRLSDREPFVVAAAATLIEALVTYAGTFMYSRVWDDIWPRFRTLLSALAAADTKSALARRGPGAVGTESPYTHTHRLYRAMLRTMAAAAREVDTKDGALWEVMVACRRFLHAGAHEELQACARDLYVAAGRGNADAVWLALEATGREGEEDGGQWKAVSFLREARWDIGANTLLIFNTLEFDGM